MNNFKTRVDLDIMLDRKDNHDVLTKHVNLRWNAELEMRSYGIKSVIITVPDQTITLDVNVWGDEDDTQEELTLDIKDVLIEHNGSLETLIPSSLEFYKGKWKLVFG